MESKKSGAKVPIVLYMDDPQGDSYLRYFNYFWYVERRHSFNAGANALYHHILRVCHESGWESSTVKISNSDFLKHIRMGKQAFKSGRQQLIDAGLIVFQSKPGRGNVSEYTLPPIPTRNHVSGLPSVRKIIALPHAD